MQYRSRQIDISKAVTLCYDFNLVPELIIKSIESSIIRHCYNTTQQLSLLKMISIRINASKISRWYNCFINKNKYINLSEWIEMADTVFKVELQNLK